MLTILLNSLCAVYNYQSSNHCSRQSAACQYTGTLAIPDSPDSLWLYLKP